MRTQLDTVSPLVSQLWLAKTPADHAAILLAASDAVLLAAQADLSAACTASQFDLGQRYIDARVAILCAVRDRSGRLPHELVDALELYRGCMALLAGRA